MYLKWSVTKLKQIGGRWPGQTSHCASLIQSHRIGPKIKKTVICHLGTVQHKIDSKVSPAHFVSADSFLARCAEQLALTSLPQAEQAQILEKVRAYMLTFRGEQF